jgi:hypothetical protein
MRVPRTLTLSMPARFYVRLVSVNMVDVDPEFGDSANKKDVPLELQGHLIQGEVRAGMFIRVPCKSQLFKHYPIHSVKMAEPPNWLLEESVKHLSKKEYDAVKASIGSDTHILNLVFKERKDFEELYSMGLQEKEFEIVEEDSLLRF